MDVITGILISLVLFLIFKIYSENKKEQKRIKKLCDNIKVGDIYRTSSYSNNPFEETKHWYVEIIEIKKDWIKYKWSDGTLTTESKENFIEFPFVKVETKKLVEKTCSN